MRQTSSAALLGALFILCADMAAAEGPAQVLPVAVRSPEPGAPLVPVAATLPDLPPTPDLSQRLGPLGLPCAATMTATPGPGATVAIHIEAPCAPSARIRVTHGALVADYLATSSGVLETVFPALTETPTFEARLPTGEVLTTSAVVPGAAVYERVVTLWQSGPGLSVHAFEFGATRGEAGHVWRDAARAPQVADAGRGGYLLALGADIWPDAARAEVYSFPAASAARSGSVRIELGADLTAATCGTEVAATTLQLGEGLPGAPVDLTFRLPDCGQKPGTILLKNLARDLKIAAE